jgi:RHS repeat-associated protein
VINLCSLSDFVERKKKSSLGDFGVRKYDDFTGRFFQIDSRWLSGEKYYSWTPYHYSANNPVSFLDPGGKWFSFNNVSEKHGVLLKSTIRSLNRFPEASKMIHFLAVDFRMNIDVTWGDVEDVDNDNSNKNGLGLGMFKDGITTDIDSNIMPFIKQQQNPSITIDLNDLMKFKDDVMLKRLEKTLLEEIIHAFDTFYNIDIEWIHKIKMNKEFRMAYEAEVEIEVEEILQREIDDETD